MCDLLIFESVNMILDVLYNFWYEGEMFRNGILCGDIFINYDERLVCKVYDYYNIDYYKKIVMYVLIFC